MHDTLSFFQVSGWSGESGALASARVGSWHARQSARGVLADMRAWSAMADMGFASLPIIESTISIATTPTATAIKPQSRPLSFKRAPFYNRIAPVASFEPAGAGGRRLAACAVRL